MKQWLMALFAQSPKASINRVMAMMVCITGCYVVIIGMKISPIDFIGIATLSGSLFTIAFGGHVASKYAEVADHKTGNVTSTQEIKDDATP